MATPVVQSYTVGTSATAPAPAKPTSLAVGDLMLSFCSVSIAGASTGAFTAPGGWTELIQVNGELNDPPLYVFGKIADSGDVAASTFTFTASGANINSAMAILLRITTTTGFGSFSTNESDIGSYGSTYNGLTGVPAGALLLMAFADEEVDGSVDIASYAISTNNPTWTEVTNEYYEQTIAINMGIAKATFSAGGSTGTFTSSSASADVPGVLLSIVENTNASGTNATFQISPTIFSNTGVNVGGTGTNTLLSVSPTIPTQSGSVVPQPTQWANEAKPTTTWTNESL